MKSRFLKAVILTAALVGMSACSSLKSAGHEYQMRGQVVGMDGKDAVVCIGSRDGVQVGQELTAYRIVEKRVSGSGKTPPGWERVKVGTVHVVQIIDEHFARTELTGGEVEVHNIVELKP